MPKTCPHCKSSDLDVDPARGDTVCMSCGSVLEENAIVSEVSFAENADGSSSVVGQFVSSEGQNKPHFSGFRHGMSKESRQLTLDRGRREIREMASQLHLNKHCIDTAFNFFKMAVQKRLSRGRRIQHIVAACLYMTCRTEGTPHMLLDFSDITQVNVFTLGKAFLVLAKELHIHLPVLGYLGRKRHFTEVRRLTATPTTTSYWKPGSYDQWQWNSKAGSTVVSVQMLQDGHPAVYPRLTDDQNLKASTMSNTFSATTKVREVPVAGIYKKEIQEFRCTSPSIRGVRSIPMTNRSLIAPPQSSKSSFISARVLDEKQMKGSHQVVRLIREQERMERTREMKRQAQISEHRMDRMYYMNGAPAKLHQKYDVTDDDLERLQSIAVSRGIKLSQIPTARVGPRSTSVPNSSPREPPKGSDTGSGTKTIIPTADVSSVGGDLVSEDDTMESEKVMTSGREDAATSDHDEDEEERLKVESEAEDDTLPVKGKVGGVNDEEGESSEIKDEGQPEMEKLEISQHEDETESLSIQSDSALLSPSATQAPLAVSGAFLTDMIGDD